MFYSVIFVVSILCACLKYFSEYYKSYQEYWKKLDKFAGFKSYPIIGNMYILKNNVEENVQRFVDIHTKLDLQTFVFKLGPAMAVIILSEIEHIEVLLGSTKEITKADEYKFLNEWLGDGLLLSTGDKWRRRRKILTPAFHFSILEQFVEVFNAKGDILIKKLKEKTNQVFGVYPYITLYALDVISEAVMGVNMNVQEHSKTEYVKAVYRMCELINLRTYSLIKRINFFYRFTNDYKEMMINIQTLHKFTDKVINERRKIVNKKETDDEYNYYYKKETEIGNNNDNNEASDEGVYYYSNGGGKKKMAFLDILLQSNTPEGAPLSNEDIREEVDTFMFEGHDTTSAAISFALYMLANHKEAQDKAFEEQRNILGDNPESPVSFQDLQNMKYLELVIKETLRMFPPVPYFGRMLKEDLQLPDGRVIPAKTTALVMIMTAGRSPKYFTDADNFIPERFLSENQTNRHPYLNLAFSAGPRNCIGQRFAMLEIKSILSKVLRSYELLPAGPQYEIRIAPEITLKDKNGQKIQIRERVYTKSN